MVKCWEQDPTRRPSMTQIVNVMSKLCALFPDSEIQAVYTTDEDWNTEDELVYEEMYEMFPERMENVGGERIKTLPQPTPDFCKPLTISEGVGFIYLIIYLFIYYILVLIFQMGWEAYEEDDMKLQTMAGFDKMMPKNIGKSAVIISF